MVQQLPDPYCFDPADPRAPSMEQWARMSPEERARVVEMLPAQAPTKLQSRVDDLLDRAEAAARRAKAEAERASAEAERADELHRKLVSGLKKGIEGLCEARGIELPSAEESSMPSMKPGSIRS